MSSALRDRLRYGLAAFLAGTAALGSSGTAWAQEAVTLETLSALEIASGAVVEFKSEDANSPIRPGGYHRQRSTNA